MNANPDAESGMRVCGPVIMRIEDCVRLLTHLKISSSPNEHPVVPIIRILMRARGPVQSRLRKGAEA